MQFLLHSFALMHLENLYHFSNLGDNFQLNVPWKGRSMAKLILYRRLAESFVTIIPSVTCMDWLHWWHNHATYLVSSSATLALNEKHKYTSTSANQVKNQWMTICPAQKLGVISQLGKGEWIVDLCHYVRLAHISVCKFMIMLID
jgi:hypothetical protein